MKYLDKHLFSINSRVLLIIGLMIALPLKLAFAQENTEEVQESFLGSLLNGKELTYEGSWAWTLLDSGNESYDICIENSSSWKRAYLCIDGRLAKIVSPAKNCFQTSFDQLSAGSHTVSVFIETTSGSYGLIENIISI